MLRPEHCPVISRMWMGLLSALRSHLGWKLRSHHYCMLALTRLPLLHEHPKAASSAVHCLQHSMWPVNMLLVLHDTCCV